MHISIHTPLTRCDATNLSKLLPWSISIHTPLTRCDDTISFYYFNFQKLFQSTHLSRGATCSVYIYYVYNFISIHTPLTRCDRYIRKLPHLWHKFQSTHLSRGATLITMIPDRYLQNFNPHTSHEVRLTLHIEMAEAFNISIHTPLTRCDKLHNYINVLSVNFNPHTSHEVRLREQGFSIKDKKFQSTHLSRGATKRNFHQAFYLSFQSTHLSRGATR